MANVKLISITPDAEKVIMYCARVSNPTNQNSNNTKLLEYCIEHKHWSIFQMAHMTVEIETSRAIAAQILRHSSLQFQEFSQRYQVVSEFEVYEARRQDLKNKQNSIDDMDQKDKDWFIQAQQIIQLKAKDLYDEALKRGVAKEQARFLLPLSTKTKMYATGNIRSWIHYIQVRTDASTQKEHRDIALMIKDIFTKELPIIANAAFKNA